MKKLMFKAKLLRLEAEMEGWKARVAAYSARGETGAEGFLEAASNIEAIGRGIENLINEYNGK